MKGRHIRYRKIRICFNNSKGYRKITEKMHKLNIFAQEAGAEIAMIKRILQKIKFKGEIYLKKDAVIN